MRYHRHAHNGLLALDILFVLNESHSPLLAHTTAAKMKRWTVSEQIVKRGMYSQIRSMYTKMSSMHGLSSEVYLAMRLRYASMLIAGVAREWKRVKSDGCNGIPSLCAVSWVNISAGESRRTNQRYEVIGIRFEEVSR